MTNHNVDLDPNCLCCQLTQRLLDVLKGASFSDAMVALTHATGRTLYPTVIMAGPAAPAAFDNAVATMHRQLLDIVVALADAGAGETEATAGSTGTKH